MRPADERFCRHTSRHYARDRCYISFFLDDHRTSRLMQHLCQPQEKPLKPLIAACPRSLTVLACFPSPCVLSGTTSCAARRRSPMACKVKGIFKGLKAFSRIFGKRAFCFSFPPEILKLRTWTHCLFSSMGRRRSLQR